MTRKQRPGRQSGNQLEGEPGERLRAALCGHPRGMHRLGAPARVLDSALPAALASVYRAFDGGELFHETLVLRSSAELRRDKPQGSAPAPDGLLWIGEHQGDDLYIDRAGAVTRSERDSGDWLAEGSRLDRWLLGTIEAEALLYDGHGEFVAEAFDDEGELTAALAVRMCRCVLARDRRAAAPRWRLARALLSLGDTSRARDELERVVAENPSFAWAWFDLAQLSTSLGELATARDDYVAAAEAMPGYEHAGFFYGHAARLAARLDDPASQATLARSALDQAPDLVRRHCDGARANLDAGDLAAAAILIEIALAVAPRDVMALDLMARLRVRSAETVELPTKDADHSDV